LGKKIFSVYWKYFKNLSPSDGCFSSIVKNIYLKSNNISWKELVSHVHSRGEDDLNDTTGMKPKDAEAYRWIQKTRAQLRIVFNWDFFDKLSARIRLEQRLNNNQGKVSFQFIEKFWFKAAVLLLAILSGAIIHSLLNSPVQQNLFTEISVPPGQMTQIKLPDGSKVWLNSGSYFKYPAGFNHSSREVYMDGEAFFDITKNTHKPFVVNTNKFAVKVMGTTFNLTAYSSENTANVTLVTGLVDIISKNDRLLKQIVPGQSASMVGENLKTIKEVDTEFYTSWKEGRIVFRKETLEGIAKKLERWYNVEIHFEDPELGKLIYSGTLLKYKPVEQVFKSLILLNREIDFVSESRIDQKDIIYVKKRK
jgi:transmembrane sensor